MSLGWSFYHQPSVIVMVNCAAIKPLTAERRKTHFVLKDTTGLALEMKKKPSVASQDAVYIVSHLPICLGQMLLLLWEGI